MLLWAVNPEGPEGTRVSAAERENQDTVSSTASRTVLGVGPQTCLRAVCGLAGSWRARLPSVRFGFGSYVPVLRCISSLHSYRTQLSHAFQGTEQGPPWSRQTRAGENARGRRTCLLRLQTVLGVLGALPLGPWF